MIKINLDKAKEIAHNKRRELRNQEFEPLDAQISKQIPGTNIEIIESARQSIRDKYAIVQRDIDTAGDVAALSNILSLL